MPTLLVINSSARQTRSVTRQLTERYRNLWLDLHPGSKLLERDIGIEPIQPINEAWIASAFAPPETRTPDMLEAIALSETLIEELEMADEIVLGVPLYNFGMPGHLKTYFDQIIRVNRSFALELGAENPYTPLLADKSVTVVISAGDGSVLPGRINHALNHLDKHLDFLLRFIGFQTLQYVHVGDEEFQDERLATSLARAEQRIDELVSAPKPFDEVSLKSA